MTDSVCSNRFEKYNIADFFLGVGGIELGFEQTNEFRVLQANEFDKYKCQTYQLNHPDTYLMVTIFTMFSKKAFPTRYLEIIMKVSILL